VHELSFEPTTRPKLFGLRAGPASSKEKKSMSIAFTTIEPRMAMPLTSSPDPADCLNVVFLTNNDEGEVLEFLSRRPIHTVCMSSFIRDHGIQSPLNRGYFYGYRNDQGTLEGVALIGHATLLETRSDAALKAFAELKFRDAHSHLIRGEHNMIQRFWKFYSALDQSPYHSCSELLFEQTELPEVTEPLPQLRLATFADLDSIVRINAQMIISECGIDPLVRDPKGFRARAARRIEQGRVWVWIKDGKLVFKADIFAQTPDMGYLEGINVHPLYRGMGYGLRCMKSLSSIQLQRSRALCLLVNSHKQELCGFYEKAGFELRGTYDTFYLDARLTDD
jgi:predicted GNAT family acetyltransferase